MHTVPHTPVMQDTSSRLTAASRGASGSASLLHRKQHHNTDKAVHLLELRTCCMTVSCLFVTAAYLVNDKQRACCCVSGRPRAVAQAVEGKGGGERGRAEMVPPLCANCITVGPYVPPHIQSCSRSADAHEPQQ